MPQTPASERTVPLDKKESLIVYYCEHCEGFRVERSHGQALKCPGCGKDYHPNSQNKDTAK